MTNRAKSQISRELDNDCTHSLYCKYYSTTPQLIKIQKTNSSKSGQIVNIFDIFFFPFSKKKMYLCRDMIFSRLYIAPHNILQFGFSSENRPQRGVRSAYEGLSHQSFTTTRLSNEIEGGCVVSSKSANEV